MNRDECECGCGSAVKAGKRFLQGHYAKSAAGRKASSERNKKSGSFSHGDGYMAQTVAIGVQVLAHVAIAERALGKPLPPKAEVHHFNGVRSDNRNSNLVICKDRAYHSLLHVRQRALEESGDPNKRQCSYCRQWDLPENLYIPPTSNGERTKHLSCHAIYCKELKERKTA